ncbi:unnamed protein product [Owenia fusiformis]|uniref:Amine oxidase n=1 Tax=Owenia fusiformis TaxID=6347 RepID=A0A8J1XSC8_OWEFU|nr:unnamed protein product [Owenia fusiformis]
MPSQSQKQVIYDIDEEDADKKSVEIENPADDSPVKTSKVKVNHMSIKSGNSVTSTDGKTGNYAVTNTPMNSIFMTGSEMSADKQVKAKPDDDIYIDGIIKAAAVIFGFGCAGLAIAFGILYTGEVEKNRLLENRRCYIGYVPGPCPVGGDIIESDPKNPSVFDELFPDELNAVANYMSRESGIDLKAPSVALSNQSYIYIIERRSPAKYTLLDYIDGTGDTPLREARVVVNRGDLNPPIIQEYTVGSLPIPTYHRLVSNPTWKSPIGYSKRPTTLYEAGQIDSMLRQTAEVVNDLILSSYDGYSFLRNCTQKCITWHLMPGSGSSGERKLWVWLVRVKEGAALHPLGLQAHIDIADLDPASWRIDAVWYNNRYFTDLNHLSTEYKGGTVSVVELLDHDSIFSTLKRRPGQSFTDKRPPKMFDPDGRRYSVDGHTVEYMGWKFDFGVRSSSGLQVHNIRFNNDRIAYEISVQDMLFILTNPNPALLSTVATLNGFIGQWGFTLIPEVDCPEHATYFDTHHYVGGSAKTHKRSVCVFETTTGGSLRRHYENDHMGGYTFAGGMPNSALVLRTTMSASFSMTFDVIFYQSGSIEVKTTPSGYQDANFYNQAKTNGYGFSLFYDTMGSLWSGFINFKIDLDVSGTSNRHSAIKIVSENNEDPRDPPKQINAQKIQREPRVTEKEAATDITPEAPSYFAFYNNEERSSFGHHRAYRIQTGSVAKQLVQDSDRTAAVAWARQNLAVTRYKEEEWTSGSIYSLMDPFDPVVDFQQFIDDDENIQDKDLVAWLTLGTHHIPSSEDVPIQTSPGNQLSFFIMPFNYFNEDPSMGSLDNIYIKPNNKDPTVSDVERNSGSVSCLARTFAYVFDGMR